MRHIVDPEMLSQRLADIGKTAEVPDWSAGAGTAEGQDRDILAGMIGALPCRVAAVIRSDNGKIFRTEQGFKCGQPPVESL